MNAHKSKRPASWTKATVQVAYEAAATEAGRAPKMAEVAAQMGVSRERARQLCARFGLPTQAYIAARTKAIQQREQAKRHAKQQRLQATVDMYADAVQAVLAQPARPRVDVAREFGIHPLTLYRLLSMLELTAPRAARGFNRTKARKVIAEAATNVEAAETLGISPHTVWLLNKAQCVHAELVRRGVLSGDAPCCVDVDGKSANVEALLAGEAAR